MPRTGAALIALSSDEQQVLREALLRRPRGLLTDIDGTISAIAPTPSDAVLLPGVKPLLIRASAIFDLVVAVSGRSAQDARRLVGLPKFLYVGNHGLERILPAQDDELSVQTEVLPAAKEYISLINQTMDQAVAELEGRFPGIWVERKGASGSIHVRNTSNPGEAQMALVAVLEWLTNDTNLRISQGKMVVELHPSLSVDKGTVVSELVHAHGLKSAFYLGDDTTDIDAFRALHRLTQEGICTGVAIGVMHPEAPTGLVSEADILLPSVDHVPSFLRWLLNNA